MRARIDINESIVIVKGLGGIAGRRRIGCLLHLLLQADSRTLSMQKWRDARDQASAPKFEPFARRSASQHELDLRITNDIAQRPAGRARELAHGQNGMTARRVQETQEAN